MITITALSIITVSFIHIINTSDIEDETIPQLILLIFFTIIIFSTYLLITILCTRYTIRERYAISEHLCTVGCRACDDCCYAFWCPCCVVAQMARHTGEYEMNRGVCCSDTGLSADAFFVEAAVHDGMGSGVC